MKRNLLFWFIITLLIGAVNISEAQLRKITNRDQAVLCEAEAVASPTPKIIIRWIKNELAINYRIQRKSINSNLWSPDIANLDSSHSYFEDINVVPGEIYEYKIYSLGRATIETSENNFYAYGYVCSGINAELPNPGKLLVLVDNTLHDALSNELAQFKNDLILEGWHVVIKKCPRAETFNKDAVTNVKEIILQEATDNMSIFLVGRVPVPYSGNLNPDAHGDHIGAWPADVFYSDESNSGWSDYAVNNTSASRTENHNIPNDGKFDQVTLPTVIKYPVGRVDFYNMPLFENSELELLKKYFEKNHKYRIGLTAAQNKCIVDDNFKAYIEGFSTSGWRLSPLVGKENISENDFMTSLETESHVWAYGTGGGSYTSAGGIGSTKDFTTKQQNGIFTMLFGSYFGDWDIQNNFLRAPLASSPSILTCSWAGRPQWYYHHMGIGLPIGFSTIATQNNINTYLPNVIYLPAYPNGVVYTIGNNQIHQALHGDPTLRLNMGKAPEIKSMSVKQPDGMPVNVSWDRVFDDNLLGYNVYKSIEGADGPYLKLNSAIISVDRYTDSALYEGEVHYMVRAVISSKTPSGTFQNEGRGLIKSLITTDVETLDDDMQIVCTPNPAVDFVDISIALSQPASVEMIVVDINGNHIRTIQNEGLAQGRHSLSWNLKSSNNSRVSSGVYFLKTTINGVSNINKLVVMP